MISKYSNGSWTPGADPFAITDSGRSASATVSTLHPWQFLPVTLACRIHRNQQDVSDYLVEESRVLRRQLRGRRLRSTHAERRRLAVKGKAPGRQVIQKIATIVTPETILSWYHELVARRWN